MHSPEHLQVVPAVLSAGNTGGHKNWDFVTAFVSWCLLPPQDVEGLQGVVPSSTSVLPAPPICLLSAF